MNLDGIRRRYDRAQQLLARKGDHPAARTRGAVVSADDVPALLAEVEELATELAEERTLHQQTIAERDEARVTADVMTRALKRRVDESNHAATEERARIVAYLREHVGDMSARDVERGDHLKESS